MVAFTAHLLVAAIACLSSHAYDFHCPNGAQIITVGIANKETRNLIVNTHNKYRSMVAQGKVNNQPIGLNLQRLAYDDGLELQARSVSKQCEIAQVTIRDSRFRVGQNLYMHKSAVFDTVQHWDTVIKAWFREHQDYTFGAGFATNTGHYTQMVWAKTNRIGCDFIMYKDHSNRVLPYHKLYTCNYGPAGNMLGETPYKTSGIPCNTDDDLCDHSLEIFYN